MKLIIVMNINQTVIQLSLLWNILYRGPIKNIYIIIYAYIASALHKHFVYNLMETSWFLCCIFL